MLFLANFFQTLLPFRTRHRTNKVLLTATVQGMFRKDVFGIASRKWLRLFNANFLVSARYTAYTGEGEEVAHRMHFRNLETAQPVAR